MRKVIFSTTVFLYHDDDYLMLHRTGSVNVDKNRLNGIGGKLENGENFLEAAIRETKEETGYTVFSKDVSFCGVVNLHGGYKEDWTICFFRIKVPSKKIPYEEIIKEGKLIWIPKEQVLNYGIELVDDLNYLWSYIFTGKVFFVSFRLNEKEKIVDKKISMLI